MDGTLVHLERLAADASWGEERREPKLPAILRIFDSHQIAEEFVDMLDSVGIYNFVGIIVGLNQQFQFIEGLPQPCAVLEDCLPLRQWLMCHPSGDEAPEASHDNVTIFSVILEDVN